MPRRVGTRRASRYSRSSERLKVEILIRAAGNHAAAPLAAVNEMPEDVEIVRLIAYCLGQANPAQKHPERRAASMTIRNRRPPVDDPSGLAL